MPRFYNSSYSKNNEPYLECKVGSKTVGMRCESVFFSVDEVLEIIHKYKDNPSTAIRYLISAKCTVRPSK